MGDKTKIEWTDATWNPIRARNRTSERIGWHCEHVSEGCRNCYAERTNLHPRSAFTGTGSPYKPGHRAGVEIFLDEKVLLKPLQWRRPRMIFPCSMTDLFADFVPDAMIDQVFAIMALCPQHTFQVLTKRPARMRAYLADPDLNNRISAALGSMLDGNWIWEEGRRFRNRIEQMIGVFLGESTDNDGEITYHDDPMPLSNVWLGTSCEDQVTADARIPDLLATPATVRFVSAEPLLGPISFFGEYDIESYIGNRPQFILPDEITPPTAPLSMDDTIEHCVEALGGKITFEKGLDWIIVGGESGPNARPMHPDWARVIRDQCASVGVAFLFKQWGEWGQYRSDLVRVGSPIATRAEYRPAEIRVGGLSMLRYGKKAAGQLLDGVNHDALPAAATPREAS